MTYEKYFNDYAGKRVRIKERYKKYYNKNNNKDFYFIHFRCCEDELCNRVFLGEKSTVMSVDTDVVFPIAISEINFVDELDTLALKNVLNLIKTKMSNLRKF